MRSGFTQIVARISPMRGMATHTMDHRSFEKMAISARYDVAS